ncbi:hypothetical protein B0H11DRAFT_2021026 [Mycena galericulata]|nr:hypothetical protein B0H11DRAFT_2021026 [Mycena galericulata]
MSEVGNGPGQRAFDLAPRKSIHSSYTERTKIQTPIEIAEPATARIFGLLAGAPDVGVGGGEEAELLGGDVGVKLALALVDTEEGVAEVERLSGGGRLGLALREADPYIFAKDRDDAPTPHIATRMLSTAFCSPGEQPEDVVAVQSVTLDAKPVRPKPREFLHRQGASELYYVPGR